MPLVEGVPQLPAESWLQRAFDYIRARSKLPDYAVFWTLVSLCGAALQDHLAIDWAPKRVFPNLPLLVVGESGLGKTGAFNAAWPLFDGTSIDRIAEDATAEAMTYDLTQIRSSRQGNTCALWVVPELADVFGQKDYQQGTVARLTRLFDNPYNREITRRGFQGMKMRIQGYAVVSWMAGTTLDWLRGHVDEAVGAGGFLPRLFTIHLAHPPKYIPDPRHDEGQLKQLNIELMGLLRDVSSTSGTKLIALGPEWEEVARRCHDDHIVSLETHSGPFVARRAENILRISMILGMFGGVTHSYTQLHMAEECSKWFELQGVNLNSALKITHFGLDCLRVEKCVTRQGQSSFWDISHRLRMLSKDLVPVLRELHNSGKLWWDGRVGKDGVIKRL